MNGWVGGVGWGEWVGRVSESVMLMCLSEL